MDEEQKTQYRMEVLKRVNSLWDEFLQNLDDLNLEVNGGLQKLEFHNSLFSRQDMRGRVILKVPEKDDAKL